MPDCSTILAGATLAIVYYLQNKLPLSRIHFMNSLTSVVSLLLVFQLLIATVTRAASIRKQMLQFMKEMSEQTEELFNADTLK